MSDFPERATCGSNHKNIFLNHIADRVTWPEFPQGTHSVEYIRSDLVPQWQPIETLTSGERVIVLFDNDHIDSGWLDNIDERRFFRTGHGKLPLTRLTHWMPIPKVPE